MITLMSQDPYTREESYIYFGEGSTASSKPASTRVVSEHPLITVDMDEYGDPIGVYIRAPLKAPESCNDLTNITRTS